MPRTSSGRSTWVVWGSTSGHFVWTIPGTPTNSASISTRNQVSPSTRSARQPGARGSFSPSSGILAYPKTSGNRGLHLYVRLEPRWDSIEVRAGAVALARELERRRPDLVTANWWKEERGQRVFVDFNQNAPHKTVFGAWSVRSRTGGQVSTPLSWDEASGIDPDELTMATVPDRLARFGDPWATMADQPQSLAPLLEMSAHDRANGLRDAPWPPQYPKQPDEPSRVAPSRARKD